MAMAAPTAPTKPTERSISLRIRAYSSAMPRRMMKAACTKRLTMLAEVKKALDLHVEEDADDDQADDDRERAALAAADPLPPRAQVVAERVCHVGCQRDERLGAMALPGAAELGCVSGAFARGCWSSTMSVIVPPLPALLPGSTGRSSCTRPRPGCRSRTPVPAPPAGRGRGWRSGRRRRRRQPGCGRPP